MMSEYPGRERRKNGGGRRAGDFCSEHCMLKKVYEKEFGGIAEDIKEIKGEEIRGSAAMRKEVDKKAPLWVVVLLITIIFGSTGGSWYQLAIIRDKLSEVYATQRMLLRSHKFSASPGGYSPAYDVKKDTRSQDENSGDN